MMPLLKSTKLKAMRSTLSTAGARLSALRSPLSALRSSRGSHCHCHFVHQAAAYLALRGGYHRDAYHRERH